MVCEKDWEPRHPQDFIRAIPDMQRVPFARPEAPNTFVSTSFATLAGEENPVHGNMFAYGGATVPSLSITSPTAASTQTGAISVTISADTNSDYVTFDTLSIDVLNTYTHNTTNIYSASVSGNATLAATYTTSSVAAMSSGAYTLSVTLTDTSGVTTVATVAIYIGDLTFSVSSNSPIASPYTITFDLDNGAGGAYIGAAIRYIRTYVDGDLIDTYDLGSSGTHHLTSDTRNMSGMSAYADAAVHTVSFQMEDVLGDVDPNFYYNFLTVEID